MHLACKLMCENKNIQTTAALNVVCHYMTQLTAAKKDRHSLAHSINKTINIFASDTSPFFKACVFIIGKEYFRAEPRSETPLTTPK